MSEPPDPDGPPAHDPSLYEPPPTGPIPAPPAHSSGPRRRFVDLTPLRESPAFARLYLGTTVSNLGAQLTAVAVGLQIYDITRSTLAVSLVGGIALLPMIVAGLWGGMLADAFDRRTVLAISATAGWLSTLGLIALTLVDAAQQGRVAVWPLYLLTTVNAVASTIAVSVRGSIAPRILPARLLPAASALNGIGFGLAVAVGPALAGVLVAGAGFAWTYAVDAVLFTAAFAGILSLPRLPPLAAATRPGLRSLREGLAFLRRAPNIRAGFLIDILAMGLGRPVVLFPAAGALVIGGGAVTVGILAASAAVGTFLTGLLSGPVGQVRHQGRAIAVAVMTYGGFTIAFAAVLLVTGLRRGEWIGSTDAPVDLLALTLACLALVGTGAADEVSAIFRSTMLATAVPDGMRGRLQGVFTVVVTGGPRLGDLFAGTLATAVALWFPPLLGGVLIVALVAIILRVQPTLRHYDAEAPTP